MLAKFREVLHHCEQDQVRSTDADVEPTADEDSAAALASDAEELLAGAVVEAAEPILTSVMMGATDNYDNMDDDEKRCFESFITSQLDSALVSERHRLR